jgi:TfoX/Sxy family transcriptional regulator of competence genes
MTHIRPFNATWTFPESGRSFTAIDDADYRGSIASVSARLLGSSMATQQRTIDFLLEQASSAGGVTAKPMFGEYGVYVDGKMIGSVCDDQLFVKPTELGRARAEPVSDVPPYPSAKPQMLIAVDRWDDAKWLGELLRVTADELPTPKPRKPKRGT